MDYIGAIRVERTDHLPLTIVETRQFQQDSERLLGQDQIAQLKIALAVNSEAGDLIPGTGGLRKIRWSAEGRGKRGGTRVIYYYGDRDMPLFLLAIYAKNERIDMSPADRRGYAMFVEQIKAEARLKRRKRRK